MYYGLPAVLKKLSFYNYFKFIRHLDPTSSDFLNIRFIGTYFSLLTTKVCSSDDEQQIRKECGKFINLYEDEKVSKDDFVKIPMWFDKDEDSPTLHSKNKDINYSLLIIVYENFNRVEKLKEIIFDINKDEDEMMNIVDLLKIFTLKAIQMDGDKYRNKTYSEVLFY